MSSPQEEPHESPENQDQSHEDRSRKNFGHPKQAGIAPAGTRRVDVVVRRNKHTAGAVLFSATVVWLFFHRIGYTLITFICRSLMLSLAALFLWSNISFYINKSSFDLPEIVLPENLCNSITLSLTNTCNQAIFAFWEVALGKDTEKFLYAVITLWLVGTIGGWFDLLTVVYMLSVKMLTAPVLYEKNEDQVDTYVEKAKSRIKRQYSLDENLLQKFSKVPHTTDNEEPQSEQQLQPEEQEPEQEQEQEQEKEQEQP